MKILLVEDDDFKLKNILACLNEAFPKHNVAVARSVSSAKRMLKREEIMLTLMDMSLPNYDVTAVDAGGRPHTFGGKDLLSYLRYREVNVPIIVITQFKKFDSETGEVDLQTLRKELAGEYGEKFRELISFDNESNVWKENLIRNIRMVINENSNRR